MSSPNREMRMIPDLWKAPSFILVELNELEANAPMSPVMTSMHITQYKPIRYTYLGSHTPITVCIQSAIQTS